MNLCFWTSEIFFGGPFHSVILSTKNI